TDPELSRGNRWPTLGEGRLRDLSFFFIYSSFLVRKEDKQLFATGMTLFLLLCACLHTAVKIMRQWVEFIVPPNSWGEGINSWRMCFC
ncbi:uncharacterized, partial [Tachysurus ichikawai]